MRKVAPAERQRNRRGEGGKLRDEIVAAATTLLERTGAEESITLRSVAREVGIAAPSIYAHFPDRDAILVAVVSAAFDDLAGALTVTKAPDPVAGLFAGCRAYAGFAVTRPARYRVLFGRTRERAAEAPNPRRLDVFQILVDAIAACVAAGRSDSTDPFADAVALWSAMHGAVSLRAAAPGFPWPPLEDSIDDLARRLARVSSGRLRA
jgi:AcrR family transcriptional regulator